MSREPLGITDFLQASSDASKRTRAVTITIIVGSVLVLAGLLNSTKTEWMRGRMLELKDEHGFYAQEKIGKYPLRKEFTDEISFKEARDLYEYRYKELCSAVEHSYVDNSLLVRVPFLGFTFDVNDMGFLAGAAFFVLLLCQRFFLARELDNLRLSVLEADAAGRLVFEKFYMLLAMTQVFTVPRTERRARSWFHLLAPKLISWMPVLIYLLLMLHDWQTKDIGQDLETLRFELLMAFEMAVSVALFILSLDITVRHLRIDRIWDQCWHHIGKPTRAEMLQAGAAMQHSIDLTLLRKPSSRPEW